MSWNRIEGAVMEVHTVGLDLAEHIFQVLGVGGLSVRDVRRLGHLKSQFSKCD